MENSSKKALVRFTLLNVLAMIYVGVNWESWVIPISSTNAMGYHFVNIFFCIISYVLFASKFNDSTLTFKWREGIDAKIYGYVLVTFVLFSLINIGYPLIFGIVPSDLVEGLGYLLVINYYFYFVKVGLIDDIKLKVKDIKEKQLHIDQK